MVCEQLAEILGVDLDAVTLDTRLREDLDADDFALIDLVEAVEAELGERSVGLTIDDDDLVEVRTVGDAVECLVARTRVAERRREHRDRRSARPSRCRRRSGWHFADPSLLTRSLAHRSWCAENGEEESNERLEFLGDSVLGLVVTHYVFEHFPHLPEGQLSEVRAGVVNAHVLAEVAVELDLGAHVLLGKGEDAAGGRAKQSILADAFEAVVAAVYLDAGFAHGARPRPALPPGPHRRSRRGSRRARLQDAPAGAHRVARPSVGRGTSSATRAPTTPSTSSQRCSSVIEPYGEGEGRSKKQAEQAAAWVACSRLREEGGDDAGVT